MWWSNLFKDMSPASFFNFSFLPKYGAFFVQGVEYTLLLAIVSVALAVIPALLLALVGAVVLIFALAPETGTLAYIHQDNDETAGFCIFLGVAILIWALIKFLKILFYKWTSEFIITDKRCILKTGLISICVSDIALDKCEGIIFHQSIGGRIFGYGTLSATTGGQTLDFPGIDSPFAFRNQLFVAMDNYKKWRASSI